MYSDGMSEVGQADSTQRQGKLVAWVGGQQDLDSSIGHFKDRLNN